MFPQSCALLAGEAPQNNDSKVGGGESQHEKENQGIADIKPALTGRQICQ